MRPTEGTKTRRGRGRRSPRRWSCALLALATIAASLLLAPPAGATTEAVGDVIDVVRGLDPVDVVTGPDGNLWVADYATNGISRVTPSGTITTFTDPTIDSPSGITVGADGNLWFTNSARNGSAAGPSIGRITTSGVVTAFTDPLVGSPGAIVAGPDGNLWFTDGTFGGQIGRITTAGSISQFGVGLSNTFPSAITTGPDGNLWFTANNFIGRITTGGSVAIFTAPSLNGPKQLVTGPDGALWFTNSVGDTIGRITTGGEVSAFGDPAIGSPHAIAVGPDGALWFTNLADDSVGRIDPTSHAVAHVADPAMDFAEPLSGGTEAITAGPDGALWFTNSGGDSLGRITTSGVVTKVGGAGSPYDLAAGPDGDMWFTDPASGTVGRVSQSGAVAAYSAPSVAAPHGIVPGPDGNLWFTNSAGDTIGRITPSGTVSDFTGTGVSAPEDIAAGPDGNLWFTNAGNDSIGRISPAGAVTNFTGTGISRPTGIAAGPDGNLWFTNRDNNTIGRITTAGVVTNVGGTVVGSPQSITSGPDGNLWFTGNGAVGRVTPEGVLSSFPGTGSNWAFGITTGPEGNLWYPTMANDTIGRLRPDGSGATTFTADWVKEPRSVAVGPDGSIWFTHARGIGRVRAVARTVPGPPVGVVATPGDGAATVRWSPPGDQGSSAVSGYTVTASPGGATCETSGALSCTVPGLTDGSPYTFSVRASNGSGPGSPSAPSDPVTPTAPVAGTWYHPVTPARLVDSRPDGPAVGGYATPWAGPQTRDVAIGGVGPVPVDAAAVVLNITVVSRSGAGYLTVWPAGQPKPLVSSLNYSAGQTVANQVTVKLGTGGKLSIDDQFGTADVIVDVNGWFDAVPGGGFTPLPPARIVDSRPSGPSVGGFSTPWGSGATRDVQVGGLGGVPSDADAVVLNVTAVAPSAGSYLTIWPSGQPKPLASSLNFAAGQVVPNAVTVKLGAGGKVSISNAFGSVDVIVDVAGWFGAGAGAAFHPIVPARIEDSRPAGPSVGPYTTPWVPGLARTVQVTGVGGVPSGAMALVGNVTAVAPSSSSYVTVWPSWYGRPFTSTLNFAAGQTVPNAATVKLGPGGAISIVNGFGTVDLVVDANGWYG